MNACRLKNHDLEPMQMHCRRSGRSGGAALFLALAFLSVFSMLGATYVRYMSLELEANSRHLHALRARHYAVAGVQNAMGHIFERVDRGSMPDKVNTFVYGFYGSLAGADDEIPMLLETYAAQAEVLIEPMEQSAWQARFMDGIPWPGEGKAFHVVSASEITRAGTGRMQRLGKHAIESVLVVDASGCTVAAWGSYRK